MDIDSHRQKRPTSAERLQLFELLSAFTLLCAAILAAHGAALGNGFVWDDVHTVVQNPAMSGLRQLWASLRVDDWAGYGLAPRGLYRPLATVSLWIDGQLSRDRPGGYHATSLLLHAVTATSLGTALRCAGARRTFAWSCALLFSVHPLATETVDWISARPDLLCGSLSLAALALATASRPVAASGASALSCFAKETGVAAALAAAIQIGAHRRRGSRAGVALLGFGVFLYLVARSAAAVPWSTGVSRLATLDGARDALVCWGGVCRAFALAVLWPLPLDATRRLPTGSGTSALVALSVVAASAAWSWRRNDPLPITLTISAAGPLAMIAVYGVNMSERYLYVPLACALGLSALAADDVRTAVRAPLARAAIALAFGGLLASCAAASRERALDWSDPERLFVSAVEANPDNPEAWVMLGAERYKAGDRRAARAAFERAASLGGESGALWSNLCAMRRESGELGSARYACDRAVRIDPWNPRARLHRGQLLLATDDRDGARREFEEALRIQPRYAPARDALAQLRDSAALDGPQPSP